MELEKHSSGIAKAGLTTGVIGTSLGALSMLSNGAGLLGRAANPMLAADACGNCCSEDHLVNRYDLSQNQKISELETQIALRDANHFIDQKSLELYQYVDSQLNQVHRQLADQAVENQKTSDSFQIVSERMGALKDEFCCKLNNEKHERRCGDNAIVNYANATFYPKQVADVKTKDISTPQTTYNPLPSQCDGCGCCGC